MGNRTRCLLLFMFFLHAVVLDGFAPTIVHKGTGPVEKAAVIAFDVCGHHAPANGAGHFDLTADFPSEHTQVLTVFNAFPPIRDEAAPSAESGKIEHPPEA